MGETLDIFTILFTINIFLIILDASVSYFTTPYLVEDKESQFSSKEIFQFLVVAIYAYFNSIGLVEHKIDYLYWVLILLVLDIVLQLFLYQKRKKP